VLNDRVGLIQLNKKAKERMVKYNLIRQKMKTKWEDIIYDCEGRIIMKCYQKRKTIDKYYEKIIKEQNEQITELNDRMKQYFT